MIDTCTDCEIVESSIDLGDGAEPFGILTYVGGWMHPGWAWSTRWRWVGDDTCMDVSIPDPRCD